MSFSQPDPASPAQVADASFSTSRRGFDQDEVRDFLRMVGSEMSRLSDRIRFLEREVEAAQTSPELSARLDEETLTRLLGEETARVLSAARGSATEIRHKAEQAAAQMVSEASDEAARIRNDIETDAVRLRADAAADAEAEVEMAKQQGREMVNEARAYRERVLSELARRRELAREQIEQLLHGRDRLLDSFERARVVAVDVVAELEPIGQPEEYVNLSPTTGPVPVMVARDVEATEEAESAPSTPEPTQVIESVGDQDPDIELASVANITSIGDETGEAEVLDDVATSDESVVDDNAIDDETVVDMTDIAVDDETVVDIAVDDEALEADEDAVDESVVDDGGVVLPEPLDEALEVDAAAVDEPVADDGDVVVDLFARIRSAADAEAETATEPEAETEGLGAEAESDDHSETELQAVEGLPDAEHDPESAMAPAPETDADDDVFAQRDAELTPLIVAAARKLKRVLADEQNEVLDTMRRSASIESVDDLVPAVAEHTTSYVDAVADDLLLGAQAGASGTDEENVVTLSRPEARRCVDQAGSQLAERLVVALRDRLERAVRDADGDATALTKKVRAVYREVKTRAIDEVLDDVFLTAYGAGVSAAIAQGIDVCWVLDPRSPANPDCEDNSLSRPVPHGQPFPTGDVTAPAHPGCRCMLQISRR